MREMVTLYKPQPPGTRFAWSKPLFIALLAGTCWTFSFSAHAQSSDDIGVHLQAIKHLSEQAMQASRAAEQAATVAEVKAHADAVFETVWGLHSGLADGSKGAAAIHGWKTRWQVDNTAFDEGFSGRYGTKPPEVEDPAPGRTPRVSKSPKIRGRNTRNVQKTRCVVALRRTVLR